MTEFGASSSGSLTEQASRTQKFNGIFSVTGKPGSGRTQREVVTPGIHVFETPLHRIVRQLFGHQALQVTDGVFFNIRATRIGIKTSPTLCRHADEVGRLVESRVNRRVTTKVKTIADQAGLWLSPITTRDLGSVGDHDRPQPVPTHQSVQCRPDDRPDRGDFIDV